MKVTVFGTGYVGLVQAAVLAKLGHQVYCVDIDEEKINNLKLGIIPIYEPGLSDVVAQGIEDANLFFTTDASVGVQHGDIIFIAVGTPPDATGAADLTYVFDVAKAIGFEMHKNSIKYRTVVIKSTVPVGTAYRVSACLSHCFPANFDDNGVRFSVVSNPEFLKEGSAVQDCLYPDRIVLGYSDLNALATVKELYPQDSVFVAMDNASAELTKYAANCMLATKISFINEMANLAQSLGADIKHVVKGIAADPRIGPHFINPGIGYGGSCFPKDVSAILQMGKEEGMPMHLLKAVTTVNDDQKLVIPRMLAEVLDFQTGLNVAVWGLAFKPNTDDIRESPALQIIACLLNAGHHVRAYDPVAKVSLADIPVAAPKNPFRYEQVDTLLAATDDADVLILCTEWDEFKNVDFIRLQLNMNSNVLLFDGRNIYNTKRLGEIGIPHFGIGTGLNPYNYDIDEGLHTEE